MKENLQLRLSQMAYGEIQAIPMIDRGPYRELEDEAESTKVSTSNPAKLLVIAEQLVSTDEDFILVERADQDIAIKQADFDQYLEKLKAAKHLIFVNCIDLGTTEIKAFLLELLEKKKLLDSKIFLLDLPQVEYLTIRDSLSGKIKM